MREGAMIRVGTHYVSQYPADARKWFTGTGLPESAWKKMLPKPGLRRDKGK